MKPLIRKLDDIGRLSIPAHLRRELGWEPGIMMEIVSDKEGIWIRKADTDSE